MDKKLKHDIEFLENRDIFNILRLLVIISDRKGKDTLELCVHNLFWECSNIEDVKNTLLNILDDKKG